MSKQTAVEWFWNQLPNILPFSLDTETAIKLQEANEQAKAIEREQHGDTWLDSRVELMPDEFIGKEKTFDQYYEETYGKEEGL